jgi:HK97 gp10 family phage protein
MPRKGSYVTGQQEVAARLHAAKKILHARVVEAVAVTTKFVQAHAKSGHEPGAHSSGRYVDQTGKLTRSITSSSTTINNHKVKFTVIANAPHALPVELGTSRTRAYPFMVPALMASIPVYQNLLANAVQK